MIVQFGTGSTLEFREHCPQHSDLVWYHIELDFSDPRLLYLIANDMVHITVSKESYKPLFNLTINYHHYQEVYNYLKESQNVSEHLA